MKNYFILPALVALAACGFTPVYGTHTTAGPTSDLMNEVAIDNIPDRNGQMLRNDLIDRMYGKGRPHTPLYHLTVKLKGVEQDLGIQADATSTRSLLDMTATYNLSDESGKKLLDGTAHSVSSFNKLSNQYGSLVSDQSAYERTIHEVSEQIVNRISLYFSEPVEIKPGSTETAPTPFIPPANSEGAPSLAEIRENLQSQQNLHP